MSVAGKDDKIPFRIKETIESIANSNIKVYFIRDSDGISDQTKSEIIDYATGKDVSLFMLKYHEIESYLINVDLIQNSLKEKFEVEIEASTLEQKLIDIMKQTISFARYGFDKTLRDVLYKTSKLVNNDHYNYGDAERDAATLRTSYESLESFEELKVKAPGKETLKEFLKLINAEHSIQLTNNILMKNLTLDQIDDELKTFLNSINPN